jgi:hypothetical protein
MVAGQPAFEADKPREVLRMQIHDQAATSASAAAISRPTSATGS